MNKENLEIMNFMSIDGDSVLRINMDIYHIEHLESMIKEIYRLKEKTVGLKFVMTINYKPY